MFNRYNLLKTLSLGLVQGSRSDFRAGSRNSCGSTFNVQKFKGERQGYALGEVARYFARDLATIGTLIGRLSGRMEEDERMRREIETLTKKVEI